MRQKRAGFVGCYSKLGHACRQINATPERAQFDRAQMELSCQFASFGKRKLRAAKGGEAPMQWFGVKSSGHTRPEKWRLLKARRAKMSAGFSEPTLRNHDGDPG